MDKKAQIESDIYRFLAGIATPEESENLISWLKESQENRLQYFRLKRIWLETRPCNQDNDSLEDSWGRLQLRHSLQTKTAEKADNRFRINPRRFSAAASIIILIGISLFMGNKIRIMSDHPRTTHEIYVPLGSRSNVILPDGTNVWLSADSKLSWDSDFVNDNRNVSLTGEAFFDVVSDNSLFTVTTRDVKIKVLGTQFNVKSYPDEPITETTLVTGEIEIAVIDERLRSRPVLLTPNQKLTYSTNARPADIPEDEAREKVPGETAQALPSRPSLQLAHISSVDEYISWKDGRLVFRSEPLKDMARKLERYYNVEITFNDESIKEVRYTGTLEDVTIVEVLRAIASSSRISYEIDNNKIKLSI
jgi:transmembrane sensor